MKFMIEAVLQKDAMQLLAYDYVLMVAGSRNYGDLQEPTIQPCGLHPCKRSWNPEMQA